MVNTSPIIHGNIRAQVNICVCMCVCTYTCIVSAFTIAGRATHFHTHARESRSLSPPRHSSTSLPSRSVYLPRMRRTNRGGIQEINDVYYYVYGIMDTNSTICISYLEVTSSSAIDDIASEYNTLLNNFIAKKQFIKISLLKYF